MWASLCKSVYLYLFISVFGCVESYLQHAGSFVGGMCDQSAVVVFRLSCPGACGILVPWPGVELVSPALGQILHQRKPITLCVAISKLFILNLPGSNRSNGRLENRQCEVLLDRNLTTDIRPCHTSCFELLLVFFFFPVVEKVSSLYTLTWDQINS